MLTASCQVGLATVGLLILLYPKGVFSIICYDCHAEQGTCNEGECEGAVCIKMETSNKQDERKTITKTCGDEMEEVACQQSGFGSKWTSRCVCHTSLCNGDDALAEAGLEPSSAAPPAASTTQFALMVAILVNSLRCMSTFRFSSAPAVRYF
ncbi:unnamed protein product, partial [Mesorhabditis spiculigera]